MQSYDRNACTSKEKLSLCGMVILILILFIVLVSVNNNNSSHNAAKSFFPTVDNINGTLSIGNLINNWTSDKDWNITNYSYGKNLGSLVLDQGYEVVKVMYPINSFGGASDGTLGGFHFYTTPKF